MEINFFKDFLLGRDEDFKTKTGYWLQFNFRFLAIFASPKNETILKVFIYMLLNSLPVQVPVPYIMKGNY